MWITGSTSKYEAASVHTIHHNEIYATLLFTYSFFFFLSRAYSKPDIVLDTGD